MSGEREREWRERQEEEEEEERRMGESTREGRRKRYHNESCSHGVNEEGLTE